MRKLALVLLAFLTGCTSHGSIAQQLHRDSAGCYWWQDGSPLMTASGKQWCDHK